MSQPASQYKMIREIYLFLFKKSVILKWSSRWWVVSGINDYITTQKTKKQDWIETKRHIEKEAKETFFMIRGSRRRKEKVEEERGVAWRQLQRKHVDDDGNASKRYFYIWKPFFFFWVYGRYEISGENPICFPVWVDF